ncbi:MAG: hypothetical protein JWR22_1140, partial [Herminiimonas sp.]|nr:hypothetical protein [Herminiimonas sp.]
AYLRCSIRLPCRRTMPGSGPATGFILLLRQKNGTKKRRPGSAAPLRGVPTPSAPKSGSGGNSLRSDSRRFLSDFATAVVAAYNGGHVKGTSKATATAKTGSTSTSTSTSRIHARYPPAPGVVEACMGWRSSTNHLEHRTNPAIRYGRPPGTHMIRPPSCWSSIGLSPNAPFPAA